MRLLILGVTLLGLVSCTTVGGGSSSSSSSSESPTRTLHLYRVDIDHDAVRRGARPLFNEPPAGREFGLERRCQGVFSASDRGFVRCVVRVAEPVIGVGGRHTEQTYTLLSFFGKLTPDGTAATTVAGERSSPIEGATELRFKERGEDKITVQAWRDGRPDAYVYHFTRRGFPNPNVAFPWK